MRKQNKNLRPKYYIARDIVDNDGRIVGREYSQDLIHCSECTHYNSQPISMGYCFGQWGMYVDADGWCYKAERAARNKEDEK